MLGISILNFLISNASARTALLHDQQSLVNNRADSVFMHDLLGKASVKELLDKLLNNSLTRTWHMNRLYAQIQA